MKTDRCREWRESLGAYALGQLPDEERASLEAHLEGCPAAGPRPSRSPRSRASSPMPTRRASGPPPCRRRSWASGSRRRSAPSGAAAGAGARLRFGLAFSGATAAAAAAVLAIFVLAGNESGGPEQHVSLPHAAGRE